MYVYKVLINGNDNMKKMVITDNRDVNLAIRSAVPELTRDHGVQVLHSVNARIVSESAMYVPAESEGGE